MGESLFIEPIKRWIQNLRTRKASGQQPEAQRPGEEGSSPPGQDRSSRDTPAEATLPLAAESSGRQPFPPTQDMAETPATQEPSVNPLGPGTIRVASARGEPEIMPEGTRLQPATQTETQPPSAPDQDSLPDSLRMIFRKKAVLNPQVQALLERHGTVGARELSEELRDFAQRIGANRGQK